MNVDQMNRFENIINTVLIVKLLDSKPYCIYAGYEIKQILSNLHVHIFIFN